MKNYCLWIGKAFVFCLLLGLTVSFAHLDAYAEPMGPHFHPKPVPTLGIAVPEPPEFRDRTPLPLLRFVDTPSIISIKIITVDNSVVNEASIRMWIDGCLPENAGPGRTYFPIEHDGAFVERAVPLQDLGFREITFGLNMDQVGCQLPSGDIGVQVYAAAGIDLQTSNSVSWTFRVDESASPIVLPTLGPKITSITPDVARFGGSITVSGEGFQDSTPLNRFRGSQLLFDGEPIETEFVSPEKLRFSVPDASCGNHIIHVRNRGVLNLDEERGLSNGATFLIPISVCLDRALAPPNINSLSTNSAAPNTKVTVFGNNFTPAPFGFTEFGSKVVLSNVEAVTNIINDRELTFTVPDNICGEMELWVENRFSTGNVHSDASLGFTIPCDIEPTARIEFDPQDPRETDTLTFNVFDAGFQPQDGPVFYHWFLNPESGDVEDLNNLGDATQCDQPCTEVTLSTPAPGLYEVFVRASNGVPQVATANISVRVAQANGNFVPDVSIDFEPIAPVEGAVFSAVFVVETSDPDGDFLNPLNYEWFGNDLNDGQPEFRLRRGNNDPVNGDANTISFANNGEYTIRVVVPDGQGGFGEATVQFTVPLNGSGPAPSPPGPSIPEALDSDTDSVLDDEEIIEAIRLWALNNPVAGTDQTISDCLMMELIRLWAADVNIRNIRAFACSGTR